MAEPLYKVVPGRQMVATSDIAKGTLILQEDAFVVSNTQINMNNWLHYNGLFQELQGRASAKLKSTSSGPRAQRCTWKVVRYIARNQDVILTINLSICDINHSCVPNATLYFSDGQDATSSAPPLGQARLVATTSIPAGTEILRNYAPRLWFETLAARSEAFQFDYDLTCSCVGCAPPLHAQLDETERSLARMYHDNLPDLDVPMTLAETVRHIDRLNAYIRILDTLRVWDKKVSHACFLLASLYLRQAQFDKALYTAVSGLLVEEHFYEPRYKDGLNEIIGTCYVKDPNLRAKYDQAALGPYSLT